MSGLVEDGVDLSEYSVDWLIFASMVMPRFNNSLIVVVHPKMSARTDRP